MKTKTKQTTTKLYKLTSSHQRERERETDRQTESPLSQRGIETGSVLRPSFWSDALPTELPPPLELCELPPDHEIENVAWRHSLSRCLLTRKKGENPL